MVDTACHAFKVGSACNTVQNLVNLSNQLEPANTGMIWLKQQEIEPSNLFMTT